MLPPRFPRRRALHPKADSENGDVFLKDPLLEDGNESELPEVLHAPVEGPDAGQDYLICLLQVIGTGCYHRRDADPPESIDDTPEVTHAVVDNRKHDLPVPPWIWSCHSPRNFS